jgi:hypothetical protein
MSAVSQGVFVNLLRAGAWAARGARHAAHGQAAGILMFGGFRGPCVAQNPSLHFVRALHSLKKRALIVARFYTRHIFLFLFLFIHVVNFSSGYCLQGNHRRSTEGDN